MMSKAYILTLLLSITFHLSYSQTETFLDTILVKKEIENSKGINVEELCSAVWIIKQATFQFQYADPEDNMIMDMDSWEGFSYTFNANGTYEVNAIIDSDGKWELRDNGN